MENSVKALFVGLSTIDVQFFISGFPQKNSKTKASQKQISIGGPATNACITYSLLGAHATLISPIGKNSFTHFLTDSIKNYKINLVDPIEKTLSDPVLSCIVTNESNGDRTIIYHQPEILAFNPKPIESFLLSNDFDIALFDGFYIDISLYILSALKQKGTTTVLDGGSWKPGLEKLLPLIDFVICSNDFLPPGTSNHHEVFDYLLQFNCRNIAITRGEKSILFNSNGIIQEIKVPKIKSIDTCGAGDVFHGAFCYFYAKNKNVEYALSEASKIASFSCTYQGTHSWMEHYLKIKK